MVRARLIYFTSWYVKPLNWIERYTLLFSVVQLHSTRWKFGSFVPNSNKFVMSNWASCELIKTACYISFPRFSLHTVVGIISTRLIVSLSNRISFWNSLLYNYHRSQWIVGQDRLRGADAWTACGNMAMEKHLQYVAWINQRLSEKLL